MLMSNLILKDESYAIIGACMHVHSILGSGFKEAVYQEALEKELTSRCIDHVRHKRLKLFYDGLELSKYFIADFLCYNKIVLEIKAVEYIIKEHEKQLLNYLKATNFQLGLLINFGQTSLQFKRFIY
jgi:GxxExxY protein